LLGLRNNAQSHKNCNGFFTQKQAFLKINFKTSLARRGGLWDNTLGMKRWIAFLIAIALGFAAGLALGWYLYPTAAPGPSSQTLRIDYKTDCVLMIAEAYHLNKDLPLAARRLSELDKTPPLAQAVQAIEFAEGIGYTNNDLTLLRELSQALQALPPTQVVPTP
jgi:hypothetical protein